MRETQWERWQRIWPTLDPEACWPFISKPAPNGYHFVAALGRRVTSAHRAMYELCVGPVPAGLEIDHLCRNRACCNPAHLEAVSHGENVKRGHAAKPATPHGAARYDYHGCRCAACKAGHAERSRTRRATAAQRLSDGLVSPEHGKSTTYSNYGCRCAPCSYAARVYSQQYNARKRVAS